MSFPINQEQVFAATNGGLDLIMRFLPQARPNKHFKIRHEGTESANLSKKDGIFFVKDWGDSAGFYSKSRHGIHIYANEMGYTYFEALLELGKELGIIQPNETAPKNITKCKYSEFQGKLNSEGFCYETKDFTEYELQTLGPLVTPELCAKYGLYSIKSYSWVRKEENTQIELCDVYTAESSELFPIFAFIITENGKPNISINDGKVNVEAAEDARTWLKIYKPKSVDKKYRFSYLGRKPKQHIFGLENVKKAFNQIQMVNDENTDEDGVPIELKKIERIVIGSGDRDSINIASTGEIVVWFNSETADITEAQINMLYKYTHSIVNIPDIDPTGADAGKKLALEFLDVKTAWLPDSLAKRKDFRGNPLKDFTDFVKINTVYDDKEQKELKLKVKRLLELARPAKFWIENRKKNKEGKPTGEVSYDINYKNAFNFLKINGFYRVKDDKRKEGYYFVQQNKHIVREVLSQEIKDFFIHFLDEKQKEKGLRFFPDELLNTLIASEKISEKKLLNIEQKNFDFTDFTPTSQFFFFDKFIWEVNTKEIRTITKGYSRYVMENDILNNIIERQQKISLDTSKLTVLEPFFKIKRDGNDNFHLEILRKDCEFLNYLISGSRVHWKEELNDINPSNIDDYLDANKFIINSEKLTEDQIYEQEMHLVNKIYAFGYMLHRYKDPSKAWCLYIMDNEVVDDSESHGRTGKTIFSSHAIRLFMNSKYLGARKKGLLESDFLYDGITEQTDYVIFDDADKRFNFQTLFTDITGDLNVNPKNATPYLIPYHDSPKFCISTNYAPYGLDSSTLGRILFVSFSNWYHGEIDGYNERTPVDDFGKRLFTEWDNEQWCLFINFSMQCLQFYLSQKDKIGAPQGNIRKRNLITEMGVIFIEWANSYFAEHMLNIKIRKEDALNSFLNYNPSVKNTSSTAFKKKVEMYCEYNGYTLNPLELCTDKKGKRIIGWNSTNNKSEEMIYIQRNSEDVEKIDDDNDFY